MVSIFPHRMKVKQWMERVNKEVGNPPYTSEESAAHWSKQSIYRIPASVTANNPTAYTPYLVSIGPYHHGSDNTKPMEKHKHRALLRFLERSNQPLHALWDSLAPIAQDLKDAYDELSPEWHDTDDFLQLMLVDGCFILEILRVFTTFSDPSQHQGDHPAIVTDYAPNDPVFSRHGELYLVPYLQRDMLMLENQLPLLVLQKLAALQKEESLKDFNDLITKRVLKFFNHCIPIKYLPVFNDSHHILEIFRRSFLNEEPRKHKVRGGGGGGMPFPDDIIRSATELVAGGITIKRSKSRSLKDISFNHVDLVLNLPPIVVDDSMEPMFLNQMAFERFHVGAGNEVTSFVYFMNSLIRSSSDVIMLHKCSVIQNVIGSEDDVAMLFHSLSKDIVLDPQSRLVEVLRQINEYCMKPWSQWRAEIVRTYITDPWAITAAAVLLFVLIIIQTIFCVLAYTKPQ